MEIKVTSVNQVNTVELEHENMTNPVYTGYNDFSSLKSRVTMCTQNSFGGSKNPITASAITKYESVTQEMMDSADNAACDANQMNTPVGRNMNPTEYDDFSSLRSRLTPQMGSSDESPITKYENITREHMTKHINDYPLASDDANRLNTDNAAKNTEYDDFTSLRLRLTAQVRSSASGFDDPATTAEVGAEDEYSISPQ